MSARIKAVMVEARFWRSVDVRRRDECWPWQKATRGGYGVFHPTKGETVTAHRFALELAIGRPLHDGMQARHLVCDNPPCCNPAHLAEGTNADNVADMVSKSRQARGSMKSRLSEDDVLSMRKRAAAGEVLAHLAAEYDIAASLVTMIVRGQRWKHVGGPITLTYRKASV